MTRTVRQDADKNNKFEAQKLRALSALTCQKSVDDLDAALVSALCALMANRSRVCLYRSLGEHGSVDNEVVLSTLEAQENSRPTRSVSLGLIDEPLKQTLAGEHTQKDCSGHSPSSSRWLFPMTSRGRTIAVLEFVDTPCDPRLDPFIDAAINIHRHQFALLDEMQRDVLTGLLNRQSFDLRLSEILQNARSLPEALSDIESKRLDRRKFKAEHSAWMGMLDIDHFKRVNDQFGHLYGDEVLILFAQLIKQNFRENDLLFRWGGEEFAVLLAPTSRTNAIAAFERFLTRVRDYRFPQVGTITASIGVAEIGKQHSPTELVGNADQALFEAKRQGRDRVLQYAELIRRHQISTAHTKTEVDLFE